MGRKDPRTTQVTRPPSTAPLLEALLTKVDVTKVRDRSGCIYVYKPQAQPPYSRHSIHYPDSTLDEDIPINNPKNKKLNGASAELLVAAAYTELMNTPGADTATLFHLEKALTRMLSLGRIKSVS